MPDAGVSQQGRHRGVRRWAGGAPPAEGRGVPRRADLVRAPAGRGAAHRPRLGGQGRRAGNLQGVADIEDLADEQASSDDAESSKPRPGIFLAALEKPGNPDPQDVAAGGTPYGAEAASKDNAP